MDEKNRNKLNFNSITSENMLPESHETVALDHDASNRRPRPYCGYAKGVAASTTMGECTSIPLVGKRPACTKVPVVLTESTVRVHTEAEIDLGRDDILEIKRTRKNVYLTQCKLMGDCYPCAYDEQGSPIQYSGVVFLEGYVRKNIEYATIDNYCEDAYKDYCVCGDIKHTTCYIPFSCSTEVILNKEPVIIENGPTREIEYFDQRCLGQNKNERDFVHSEVFNEPIYCELEEAYIYESDIIAKECPEDYCECPKEKPFRRMREKMVICITFKLLQNQQIECPRKPRRHLEPNKTIDHCGCAEDKEYKEE